ncbi:DUF4190 domain-containing protein [Streptomyces cellostaticus]|uniref:DUF4190 domain-containing protein n=1 Tax=Streptomyces cellostaticus TaxID=67285 RepID=UPI00202749A5|nr:DUF4190 domain-containing protein [Streptomyces cellostaticus]
MSIPPPPGPQQPHGPYQPPQPPHPQGPGYQPWAQGYSPYNRPAPVNGLAITSLVFGLLCCLPGLGLVFGLIALRQVRRRGERGTALAVTGSVLSGIGLALWALMLATGGASSFWEGVKEGARDGADASLVTGECFDSPGGTLSGGAGVVTGVPCSGEHDGEVFASFRLRDGGYPGDGSVTDTADERCYGLRYTYAMDAWAVPDDVDVYYFTPTARSWSAGDREVTCVFGNVTEGANLTGSLRNDATVLDADQRAYLRAAHLLNAAMESAPEERYVEDDLPGHRAWAGRITTALDGQARSLRGHEWPARARKPVTALAADLDRARAEWAKAAKAKDAGAFYRHYETGLRLLDPEKGVPARTALGLDTTPPAADGRAGGDARDGDSDGGSGMAV